MSLLRIHRYRDQESLAEGAASHLIREIATLQRKHQELNLCLSHGRTAELVYEALSRSPGLSAIDPASIDFWWNSENFVSMTDPARNATTTLALLGQELQVVASKTHPMPAKSANSDQDAAAFAYASDLEDTKFDICMLGVGSDGHVAAIYPNHPSFSAQATTALQVMGVTNAPAKPHERTTLTFNAINRSSQVWFFVSGEYKAEVVAATLAGDPDLPTSHVHGVERTLWFLDEDAASLLPRYRCPF